MTGFSISFYFISGMMLGVEIQRMPEDDKPILVIDLLILRMMFEWE
jgi:hypothetical protein